MRKTVIASLLVLVSTTASYAYQWDGTYCGNVGTYLNNFSQCYQEINKGFSDVSGQIGDFNNALEGKQNRITSDQILSAQEWVMKKIQASAPADNSGDYLRKDLSNFDWSSVSTDDQHRIGDKFWSDVQDTARKYLESPEFQAKAEKVKDGLIQQWHEKYEPEAKAYADKYIDDRINYKVAGLTPGKPDDGTPSEYDKGQDSKISQNSEDIQKNSQAISNETSRAKGAESSLSDRIDVNSKDIGDIKETDSRQDSQINRNQNDIASNKEDIQKNTDNIQTNSSRIDQVNQDIANDMKAGKTYVDGKAVDTLNQANAYTDNRYNQLNGRMNKLRARVDSGVAGATAIGSLSFDTLKPNSMSGGLAVAKNKVAGAWGYQRNFNENWRARATIAVSDNYVQGGASVGYSW